MEWNGKFFASGQLKFRVLQLSKFSGVSVLGKNLLGAFLLEFQISNVKFSFVGFMCMGRWKRWKRRRRDAVSYDHIFYLISIPACLSGWLAGWFVIYGIF